MATLAVLRKQAKQMGIPAAQIKKATTAAALNRVISQHGSKPQKRSGSTVTKRSASGTVRKSASRKSVPAKSTRKTGATKAKRPTSPKASSNGYQAKGGRNVLEDVDFTYDEGWNAREGSPPDRIIHALRKARGNRDKAYDALVGDVWDFVGKVKRDGSKRTKQEAQAMLVYRIARTAWDFAIRTGQHEAATNRVEYGTGPNSTQKKQTTRARRVGRPAARPKTRATASKTRTTAAKKKRSTTGRRR